jgi:plasmid rolling circle replication initiator protein Rep
MPNTAQTPVYLSALSPRDIRFEERRAETDRFITLYRKAGYDGYADRMNQCSTLLDFALDFEDNGVLTPKLQTGHFCRVRLCPICQWRKSVMWQAKAIKTIPKIVEDYPKARFIFLTLTVKNCELADLRETLAWMHKSWTKLVKRKEWASVQGWIRSVEVTRAADDTAHPHYHAILMVKPGYFGGSHYVSQAQWSKTWQDCLQVPYTPIVDVRSVRPGKREKGSEGVLMSSAICETLKYSVKPAECLAGDSHRKLSNEQWLAGITSQLFKTRSIATGGILKNYLKELENEPEDLIHADDEGLVPNDESSPRLGFKWQGHKKRYEMVSEFS